MPPIFYRITVYWDNGSIETFHTLKSSLAIGEGGIAFDDDGIQRMFNRKYIRRFDLVEE